MNKRIEKMLFVVVIISCFGFWYHKDEIHQSIAVNMNKDIEVKEIETRYEYIASATVGIANVPEDELDDYILGIQVKLYDSSSHENEITQIADFEIRDDMKLVNGDQPVSVKIKIKEPEMLYNELHVVMTAQLDKTNI